MTDQKKIVMNLTQKKDMEFFLYEYPEFEMRIKEEMMRSDLFGTSFTYMEIIFDKIPSENCRESDLARIWDMLLSQLNLIVRGSDAKGFLKSDLGIGVLFFDSDKVVLRKYRDMILKRIRDLKFEIYLQDPQTASFVDGFQYPVNSGES